MENIDIVHWKYADGSDKGIVGVFDDEQVAELVHAALEKNASQRIFEITSTSLNTVI